MRTVLTALAAAALGAVAATALMRARYRNLLAREADDIGISYVHAELGTEEHRGFGVQGL